MVGMCNRVNINYMSFTCGFGHVWGHVDIYEWYIITTYVGITLL